MGQGFPLVAAAVLTLLNRREVVAHKTGLTPALLTSLLTHSNNSPAHHLPAAPSLAPGILFMCLARTSTDLSLEAERSFLEVLWNVHENS